LSSAPFFFRSFYPFINHNNHHRSIEELPAPDFKRNPSTDLIRQRAVEKERTREASMHTPEHIIQRMQFTFAVDPPAPSSASASASSVSVSASSANANNNAATTTFTTTPAPASAGSNAAKNANANANGNTKRKRTSEDGVTVRLPTIFSTSFGPAALLYPAPSLAPRMNYGEAHTHYADRDAGDKEKEGGGRRGRDDDMRIARPTIELPLDELLNAEADGEEMGMGMIEMGMDMMGEEEAQSSEQEQEASSESGDNEGMAAKADVGVSTMNIGEDWAGWDEIMRGANMGGFDAFHYG
jgi:hypothetical protein